MTQFCTECGATLNGDTFFCPECGAAMNSSAQAFIPRQDGQQEPETEYGRYYDEPYQEPAQQKPTAYGAGFHEPPPEDRRARGREQAPVPPRADGPYAVVGTGSFIGILLLMMVPVVNFIVLIVWACGGCRKVNTRNFARAQLIVGVIMLAVSIGLFFWIKAWWDVTIGMNLDEMLRMLDELSALMR